MSNNNISTAFVTIFESEVHQAYQSEAKLAGTVRTRANVEGSTVKFPILAKGTASVRSPGTQVTPVGADFSSVTATMVDYSASEYSDIFNQAKVNFDERAELAEMLGKAIARREDQVVIDALINASAGSTVANTVVTSGSATASDLNVGKIIEAGKLLNAKNVPSTERYLLVHANSMASLLGDERAVSSDFIQLQALARGELSQFAGFNIIMFGDRDEGGIPIDGSNDRTCVAFHKSAIGLGIGMPAKTEINYIPERTSFLVTAMYSAGAIAVDVNGICDVTCRES